MLQFINCHPIWSILFAIVIIHHDFTIVGFHHLGESMYSFYMNFMYYKHIHAILSNSSNWLHHCWTSPSWRKHIYIVFIWISCNTNISTQFYRIPQIDFTIVGHRFSLWNHPILPFPCIIQGNKNISWINKSIKML
jgi:hypothetical protein